MAYFSKERVVRAIVEYNRANPNATTISFPPIERYFHELYPVECESYRKKAIEHKPDAWKADPLRKYLAKRFRDVCDRLCLEGLLKPRGMVPAPDWPGWDKVAAYDKLTKFENEARQVKVAP